MKQNSEGVKYIVLTGPTASGKTSLIVKIARKFPIEVVSCDSRQIYKFMDIGTAKPGRNILNTIKHHLIDIKTPDETYSAFQFYTDAKGLLKKIVEKGKVPIISGGTILYILSLQRGLFRLPDIPEGIRVEIRDKIEKLGPEKMHEELMKVDPERAEKIDPRDRQRIARSLEIFYATGIPHSEWLRKPHVSPIPLKIFSIRVEPEILRKRIEERVEDMFKKGWVEEVENLVNMGYNEKTPGFSSVGYREVLEVVRGRLNIDTAMDMIKKKTWQYSRRQRNFIKGLKGVEYIKDEIAIERELERWLEKR